MKLDNSSVEKDRSTSYEIGGIFKFVKHREKNMVNLSGWGTLTLTNDVPEPFVIPRASSWKIEKESPIK